MDVVYATVPKLWPDSTVVCIGGGPSLTPEDVDACRGRARVIAVNDAVRLATWADALMASDEKWWRYHNGVPEFSGWKFSLQPGAARFGVQVLKNTGQSGLELSPWGLRSGWNSGAAAINLAVHFGAAKILLLGYDMQRTPGKPSHWFGEHPAQIRATSPYETFRAMFETMVEPLATLGVRVVNCSRATALDCFPKAGLEEALS